MSHPPQSLSSTSTNSPSSPSVVRAPPSPPDSIPSSPVVKGLLAELSHSSSSSTSTSATTTPKANTTTPSRKSDPDSSLDAAAPIVSSDVGSRLSSGDSMATTTSLGFSNKAPDSKGKEELAQVETELEEGEVPVENARINVMSNSASSTGAALSPTANEVTPTPTPAPVIVKAGSPPRSQNADTTPLAPLAPKTEDNGADFVSSTVNMSGSTPTLPSLPSATTTSSSLSTMDSSTTFHTASSSATSISTSGSVKESVGADSAPIAGSMAPSPVLVHGIPESGTINLEELTKSSISTLNPHAAEHIPTSSSTPAILSSLENAGGEMSTSASAPAVSESSSSDYKTPNVYINGLPPHFPEDQLFELAAPFGEVKSVRSFTRHVGEKRSGYGFVLFETVDSAEKCIQSLRRFRNLHPTFSKQAHKIPGLPYTQSGPTWQQDASVTGSGSGHRNAGSPDAYDPGSGHTFKSKMEKFHDPSSTNLYMEGLPLSIDETSLAALVSPHRIKSQRFFQTRLSNPPRIIAFVRLETRTGAEEVIERLHGRMVRGWNDPGSRISVRFADTSEQRELRRTERTVREDDTSSARLTIAQAALLNLRGREQLRSQNGYTAPVIGTTRTQNAAAPTANQVYHDFTSNAHDGVNGGYRGSAHDISNAAIALVNAKNVAAMSGRLSNQRPKGQLFDQGLGGVNADRRTVTPQMAALLDSLRGKGQPWTGVDDRYGVNGGDFDVSQNPLRHSYPLGDVDINLGYSTHAPQTRQVAGSGASQARSGYTPAEEYILQNHQMNQRRRQPQGQHQDGRDQADFNVGVRGYRTQASTLALPQPSHGSSAYYSGGSPLPAVLEDEFHAGQAITPQGISTSHRGQPSSSSRGVRDGELASQYTSHTSNAPSTQSSQVSNRNYNNSQAHVRSTTLPPSSTSTSSTSSSGNRHYQHNSMSVPKSRNLSSDILRTTSQHQHQQQQTSQTLPSKHRSTNSISSNIVTAKDLNNHSPRLGTNEFSSHRYDSNLTLNTDPDYKKGNGEAFNSSPHTVYSSNASSFRGGDVYDAQSSPPLVSPALTYSSRGSAATLSPSTPYVGSFPSSTGGTFGGHGVGVGVDEVSDR